MARVLLRVSVSVTRGGIRITIELLPPGAGFQAGDAVWARPRGVSGVMYTPNLGTYTCLVNR